MSQQPPVLSNRPPLTTLQQTDAKHHLHPFSDSHALAQEGARVIERGEGVYIYDADGKRLLDGMSGLWNVAAGYGRTEIVEAITQQLTALPFYNTFFKTTHRPAIELSELLAQVSPPQFNRAFFTSSGSEANDTIIRMVRVYWATKGEPEKQVIISRKNGYHGSTIGGASLGGMAYMHAQGGLPIPGIHHIPQPYWYGEGGDMDPAAFGLARARELETAIETIGAHKVAAFIGEPVQGAGGVIIPPETYWPEIQRISDRYGILLISDEVICGFGRTGNWFGCETFGFRPDLIAFAKAVSSGYQPIGGVLVSDKVAEVLDSIGDDFNHGFTNSAHPAGCAAAIANICILQREGLIERIRDDIGPYFQRRWQELADHPLVGEARMTGLIGALELTTDKAARAPFAKVGSAGTVCRDISFANGLIMRATRDTMLIAPPFIITRQQVDDLVETARTVLNLTAIELKSRGML
ncbi:aspartate aminotransferase family protein [Pararhizobium sp.]|uniref:aspartate aminotransferase family protein n=1 Tax=Pararhizobium sp. TaxID=1977563 RepID=UPI0027243969|nr:aspartate aminotransferase family protein [Pararhizobium sp.]MDO9416170.1 aspartate aminotransferase family protein [Pararhizobium sp.]